MLRKGAHSEVRKDSPRLQNHTMATMLDLGKQTGRLAVREEQEDRFSQREFFGLGALPCTPLCHKSTINPLVVFGGTQFSAGAACGRPQTDNSGRAGAGADTHKKTRIQTRNSMASSKERLRVHLNWKLTSYYNKLRKNSGKGSYLCKRIFLDLIETIREHKMYGSFEINDTGRKMQKSRVGKHTPQ